MKNTTTILRGLLDKGEVSTDENASLEIESTKFYLYAVLEILESGFSTDYTFAAKEGDNLIPITLTKDQEDLISAHLLASFPEDTLSEDTISQMDFSYALSIY